MLKIVYIWRNLLHTFSFQPPGFHPPLLTRNFIAMEASFKINEIKSLFGRLQEAKLKAEILKTEIESIKSELEKAEGWSIFQFLKKQSSEEKVDGRAGNSNRSSSDEGPAPKKGKYDFPMDDGYVVVYTDGACENNGRASAKAGIGVWFSDNHPLNVSKPVTGKATNNVGEIQACISAVQIARDNGIKKLKIVTDSQFTINSMTKWIKGWKRKNWKLADGKSDVKNKIDFQKLDQLCQGLDIKWEYVPGHSGIEGNEKADLLAREGAKNYKMDQFY